MQWRRFLKQLELSFSPRQVIAFSGIVGQPLRLPSSKQASDALALQHQARELLRALGADKLAREIRVEWNPRLKTCAGRADYREKLVSLNPLLLDVQPGLAANKIETSSNGDRELDCLKQSSLTNALNPLLLDHAVESAPNATVGQAHRLPCSKKAGGARALQFQATDEMRTGKLDWFNQSSLTSGAAMVPNRGGRRAMVCDEIERTLRHELAHLLAQFRVGRRRIAPHGTEWRKACRDLGIAGEARCHSLPFATKAYAVRFVYRCPNCKGEFPRVRKIHRAIACLACCRKHNRGDFDARFRLKLTTKL